MLGSNFTRSFGDGGGGGGSGFFSFFGFGFGFGFSFSGSGSGSGFFSGSGSGLSSRSLGATGGFETMQSGSNIGSGSDFSNALMQPFTVVNFFIATGK